MHLLSQFSLSKWLLNHDFGFCFEQEGKQHPQDPVLLRANSCSSHPWPAHMGSDAGTGLLLPAQQLGLLKEIQGLEKQEGGR